jgi:hypothetical protein
MESMNQRIASIELGKLRLRLRLRLRESFSGQEY